MTILTLRRPLSAAGSVSNSGKNSALGLIRRWRHMTARWIARSRQRRALREIAERADDYLLKDMGVSRAEALREADKPFWQP
jgi:uncharacterized protein YjiS (DUF1127 family)